VSRRRRGADGEVEQVRGLQRVATYLSGLDAMFNAARACMPVDVGTYDISDTKMSMQSTSRRDFTSFFSGGMRSLFEWQRSLNLFFDSAILIKSVTGFFIEESGRKRKKRKQKPNQNEAPSP